MLRHRLPCIIYSSWLFPHNPGDKCVLIEETPTESATTTSSQRRRRPLSSRIHKINRELLDTDSNCNIDNDADNDEDDDDGGAGDDDDDDEDDKLVYNDS